jgi:hypothetical protein
MEIWNLVTSRRLSGLRGPSDCRIKKVSKTHVLETSFIVMKLLKFVFGKTLKILKNCVKAISKLMEIALSFHQIIHQMQP